MTIRNESAPVASITVFVTSGSAVVYGGTVDNRTGDPSFQVARFSSPSGY